MKRRRIERKEEAKIRNQAWSELDFKEQLNQMDNMGNISDIMKFMPKMKKTMNFDFDKKKIIWIKALIDSMTLHERKNPEIINGSRRKRIAIGSGRTMQEVNQ